MHFLVIVKIISNKTNKINNLIDTKRRIKITIIINIIMIIGQKLAIIIIVLFSTAMIFAPSLYTPIEEEKKS